jgi:hypothetical protein
MPLVMFQIIFSLLVPLPHPESLFLTKPMQSIESSKRRLEFVMDA